MSSKCLVPIFAICSNEFARDGYFKNNMTEDRYVQPENLKNHFKEKTITQEDINITLALRPELQKFYEQSNDLSGATISVDLFFKAAEGSSICNDLVNFILDKNLQDIHLYSLDAPNLFNILRKGELNNKDR